jgi:hypothetical protein
MAGQALASPNTGMRSKSPDVAQYVDNNLTSIAVQSWLKKQAMDRCF